MNPYLIVGLLVAAGVMTGGAYYQGRQDGANQIEAQQKREGELSQKAADAATSAAATAISQIKIQHRTVQQEVQREVAERIVYRECLHSPDGLRNINAALTGRAARPEAAGSGVLPGAGTPD